MHPHMHIFLCTVITLSVFTSKLQLLVYYTRMCIHPPREYGMARDAGHYSTPRPKPNAHFDVAIRKIDAI